MNRKKIVVWLLTTVLLTTESMAEAQQPAKIPTIGYLGARPPAPKSGYEVIRHMLRELGYVEGKNIVFEYRSANNNLDRLPALADELVRLKVDVLLTPSTVESVAAKNATRTIPIVFISSDPIGDRLVESLARPGGNLTGLTTISPVLAGKRLELLKETVPKLSRVAVLWDSQNPSGAQSWKESQLAARELGLKLYSMEVSRAEQFEAAFKKAVQGRNAALAVISSSFINSYQKRIADLATKNRLPAIYTREDFVENGGLMSYGRDDTELLRRVAVFVDKILKGAKPADLPVEQPTKFEFVINLKTAKALNLTIPQSVLYRADKVIR